MVVLSFFLCYNVQQAQQKNKRREAAFVFLCLLQRANLLRSRRRSAEARVCEYAPEGGRGEEQSFCEAEEGARKRRFASMHPKGGRGEEQSYCEAEEGARKRWGWTRRFYMAKEKGLSFYKKRKKINSALVREIFNWLFGILAAVFIAVVLNLFFGMTTNVVGSSMEPALYNGQKIWVDRFRYILSSPKKGDVVVFLPKGNENAHYYVKRVVADPGDKVLIRDGVLYVNGVESSWVTEKFSDPGIAENEFVLQSGEFFCVGDNPGQSEDSRSANIGPVKESDIVGKAWFHSSSEEDGMGLIK